MFLCYIYKSLIRRMAEDFMNGWTHECFDMIYLARQCKIKINKRLSIILSQNLVPKTCNWITTILFFFNQSLDVTAQWTLPVRQSPSPSRKLAHLAVIAQLALQSRPAFTRRAPASFLSLHPSTPPPPTPQPSLACFLSLSRKGDPLYSSEIKTGRCKLQINVIKCLRYHKPSHQSGWLAGFNPPAPLYLLPLLPPHQHGLAAPSLCLSVEADR